MQYASITQLTYFIFKPAL